MAKQTIKLPSAKEPIDEFVEEKQFRKELNETVKERVPILSIRPRS